MFPHATTAGPADPDRTPDPDEAGLSRVMQTAQSIANRVRRAFAPDGFAPLRVLVVDDHPDAADSLAAVLELLDCPVRACLDGPSALVAAGEFDTQVCLIDLGMPGMDGLELASRLKVRAAGRPLVLVAAMVLGDTESRARTTRAGFHEHLTKPVDAETLIDALARLGHLLTRPPTRSPRTSRAGSRAGPGAGRPEVR
jgi:CheY-like chemotaxis protein